MSLFPPFWCPWNKFQDFVGNQWWRHRAIPQQWICFIMQYVWDCWYWTLEERSVQETGVVQYLNDENETVLFASLFCRTWLIVFSSCFFHPSICTLHKRQCMLGFWSLIFWRNKMHLRYRMHDLRGNRFLCTSWHCASPQI